MSKVNMERRHFQLISQTIAGLPETTKRESVAKFFAIALQNTNSRFNMEKFLMACGLSEDEVKKSFIKY